MCFTQSFRKSFFCFWNSDQMNMIVHQAVCPDCNFCSFSFLSHKLDIVTFIISTKKNILITISSLSNMMRNTWNYHSC